MDARTPDAVVSAAACAHPACHLRRRSPAGRPRRPPSFPLPPAPSSPFRPATASGEPLSFPLPPAHILLALCAVACITLVAGRPPTPAAVVAAAGGAPAVCAAEPADDADLLLDPPKDAAAADPAPERTETAGLPFKPDDPLPPAGTILTREYKGAVVQVQVLQQAFEYAGQVYKSLGAVAKAVTGSHCNGYAFFRMGQQKTK
jgi:hypothetical protein